VYIQKAGEIIPEVVEVIVSDRDGSEVEFKMPSHCPACGEEVIRLKGESAVKCVNMNCSAQLKRNIIHFVSRDAMNIEGMGPKIVDLLIDNNLLFDVSDIYFLKKESLLSLPRMGEKSVDKLLASINDTKQNHISKLVFGLGIRFIGLKAAKNIATHFMSIHNIARADYNMLLEVDEIGNKMAESIVDFFKEDKNIELIKRLESAGLNFQVNENKLDESLVKGIFDGKVFVLTGTLTKFTRNQASEIIESKGGKISSSISKKTSYLVAGDEAGSKLKKANEIGVIVLSEEEFEEMINE
ncbi:MAG: helix-hairpin-helix domain-containing protein, partial [Clostridium sp.]